MALVDDLRFALRLLLKDRRLTVAAVLALSLGIGATTTMFALVNAAIIRPLPYANPDRLVFLDTATPGRGDGVTSVSLGDLRDVEAAARTLDSIGAARQATMGLSDDRGADQLEGAYVSANTFRLLGIPPVLGRDFTASDDRPGTAVAVLIAHSVWQTRYGGDPSIVGRNVRVNGFQGTIVGVMPPRIGFPQIAEVWLPLSQLPGAAEGGRGPRVLEVQARLKPGVTLAQAEADLREISTQLEQKYPATNRGATLRVQTYHQHAAPRPLRRVFYALFGAVGFVLVIACANVANLLLARAAHRSREIAMRMSLGAGRGRIVRQLLVESVLLAGVAGLVGFGLAAAGVRAFAVGSAGTGVPLWLSLDVDVRVFAFVSAISLGAAVLFGLAPALHTTRVDLVSALSDGGRDKTGHLRTSRLSGVLVAAQFALAVTLLAGAGLMTRTLLIAATLDTGIDTSNLMRVSFDLGAGRYPDAPQRVAFYRQLQDRLSSAPGLPRVTMASQAPRAGGNLRDAVAGTAPLTESTRRTPVIEVSVADRYFDTLGAVFLRGRPFEPGEGRPGRQAAVINERLAGMLFPGGDAIGQPLRLLQRRQAAEPMTVVGVIADVRQLGMPQAVVGGGWPIEPVVYVPLEADPLASMTIIARAPALGAAVAAIRQQVQALDPDLPLYGASTIEAAVARRQWSDRLFGAMFGVFALVALTLATIGLSAMTAFAVAQRTREIGLRVALGAQRRQVLWVVSRRAAIQLGAGATIGLAGAIGVGRLMQGDLVQVSPSDLPTLVAVTALLLLSALVAGWMPARRALRLDPAAALRTE